MMNYPTMQPSCRVNDLLVRVRFGVRVEKILSDIGNIQTKSGLDCYKLYLLPG